MWMYHKILKRDVFVADVEVLGRGKFFYSFSYVVWYDEDGREWRKTPLCDFEPPQEH